MHKRVCCSLLYMFFFLWYFSSPAPAQVSQDMEDVQNVVETVEEARPVDVNEIDVPYVAPPREKHHSPNNPSGRAQVYEGYGKHARKSSNRRAWLPAPPVLWRRCSPGPSARAPVRRPCPCVLKRRPKNPQPGDTGIGHRWRQKKNRRRAGGTGFIRLSGRALTHGYRNHITPYGAQF